MHPPPRTQRSFIVRPIDPIRRIRRWHTYLVVWSVHRVAGLGAALLLVLLSMTGSVLVLHHEVERWRGAPYRITTATVPDGAPEWNAMIERAASLAPPGYRAYRLMPPAEPDETVHLMFLGPDGATRWSAFADPRDGALLWHGPDQALLTPWILRLHMNLRLGPWGYAVTGAVGGALVLLGLTGLYLHRDGLVAMWRRPPWRRRAGARALLRDLHTWTGVVSLYFSLVLGATGLAFAILILPGQLRKTPPTAPAFALAELTPLEPLVEAARAALPGQELLRITLPATGDAPVRFLLLDRTAPVWAKFSTVDFDPRTGALTQVRNGRDASTKQKWRAIVAPLHFGFYGATWVKWAYAVGGLAPAVLAVTGSAIWWRRSRRKLQGSAAPASPARDAGPAAMLNR